MCPLQGLSQRLANSMCSTNGRALKLPKSPHQLRPRGPSRPSAAAGRSGTPSYTIPSHHQYHCPALGSPAPTPGKGARREEGDPTPPPSPGHSLSFSQGGRPLPGTGGSSQGAENIPQLAQPLKFYNRSCSQRKKAGAKPINFLNTPKVQIKHGLPGKATA